MAYGSEAQLYAVGCQPYAKYARAFYLIVFEQLVDRFSDKVF